MSTALIQWSLLTRPLNTVRPKPVEGLIQSGSGKALPSVAEAGHELARMELSPNGAPGKIRIGLIIAMGLMFSATLAAAQETQPMKLPQPRFETGMPLMQALRSRKSTREFGTEKLSAQTLSDLLWAAFGVNRPETGNRTAPSTRNWQDIDIYVASADGLYLFEAKNHELKQLLAKDIRAQTGTQDFVKDAPVNLIYVSDFSRMDSDLSPEDKRIAAAIDTGFIGQNVYLYCASAGLVTVVRGSIDKDVLAKAMRIGPTQWIVAAQSVGFPKK